MENASELLLYLVFASCVLVGAVKNRAAELRSGDWTISKSEARERSSSP